MRFATIIKSFKSKFKRSLAPEGIDYYNERIEAEIPTEMLIAPQVNTDMVTAHTTLICPKCKAHGHMVSGECPRCDLNLY